MFGKQKNIAKEITNLSNHHLALRRKLFEEISLELTKLESHNLSKKELKILGFKFYTELSTKYNNWSLEELGAILTSLRSPNANYTRASQIGILFNKRHIAYLEGPQVFEIENLTLPKKIHHQKFACKDFSLEEVIFMTFNNENTVKTKYLKLYVLVNTNTQEIYAVMPPNHQFHEQSYGIYTLLDTATFPNSHRFVLGPTTKISNFKHLLYVEGSKILLDTKHNTITKLGTNKIQNMAISKDGQTTAFSLLRPTKIITRQYIDLETGKYIQEPLLALTEPNALTLTAAQKVEILKKLSGKHNLDPYILAKTFKSNEKFDGKPVPENHFVIKNSLGETFLKGTANTNPSDLPIIKTKEGKLVVQADYPQSIISEEVYGTQGQQFNKRYYDYSGHRLALTSPKQTTCEVTNPNTKDMHENIEKLEF